MTCAWTELLAILPLWMRSAVDDLGKQSLRELRLRVNLPPELVLSGEVLWLERTVSPEDVKYVINAASQYSPWAAMTTAQGYLTAKGGHRIGICGDAVIRNGEITGLTHSTSLCIRIARDFPGIAAGLEHCKGSILILGPPGWGKTTLLRDLIRQIGQRETVCVADERRELFPDGISRGKRVDILTGCGKRAGIAMLLRTMGPDWIAVDEITDPEDCKALLHAANCGVRLLATAHALTVSDLYRRKIYEPLVANGIFEVLIQLKKDNSYTMERMTEWTTGGSVRY